MPWKKKSFFGSCWHSQLLLLTQANTQSLLTPCLGLKLLLFASDFLKNCNTSFHFIVMGVWNAFDFRIGSLVKVVYFELLIDLTVSLKSYVFEKTLYYWIKRFFLPWKERQLQQKLKMWISIKLWNQKVKKMSVYLNSMRLTWAISRYLRSDEHQVLRWIVTTQQ